MRTHLLFSSVVLAALAAAPAGCGSLDAHTDKQTSLATIQGTLDVQGGATIGSNVRIGVLWLNQAKSSFAQWSVEDLPVQPVFPASFTLPLTAAPPADSILPETGPDNKGITGFSVGIVVAYEDVNGNGKLDLVPSDATQFVDKIVGVNPDTVVVYLTTDGTFSSAALPGISPGYNLATTICPVFPGGPKCDAPSPFKQWNPIDTAYDLTLTDQLDPKVDGMLMCQGYVGFDVLGIVGGTACASATPDGGSVQVPCPDPSWNVAKDGPQPGGYAKAGDPGLTCNGSTSYTYSPCASLPLCSDSSYYQCKPESVELGGAAPPAGWPCP